MSDSVVLYENIHTGTRGYIDILHTHMNAKPIIKVFNSCFSRTRQGIIVVFWTKVELERVLFLNGASSCNWVHGKLKYR